jgi:hypothetical protein
LGGDIGPNRHPRDSSTATDIDIMGVGGGDPDVDDVDAEPCANWPSSAPAFSCESDVDEFLAPSAVS